MDNLKSWLERPDNPGSFYELLDCPCFCQDRERLLAAVRTATRVLHPYENHKTGEIVRRARSLQLLCATAGNTFSDDAKWRAYDDQLKLRLRDEYFAQAPDADVRKWLLDQRGVSPDRLDEIALFMIASNRTISSDDVPNTSATPESPPGVPGDSSPASPPPRVGPPPLPIAGSRPTHQPPPLPPRRQPTRFTANAAAGDPAETAIALNAVTMTVPVQPPAPKAGIESAGPPGGALSPAKMSGPGPAMTIQQNEHQHPVSVPLGKREKMALWLSGVFVAMAVVGIIILLSLGQSSRKTAPHRQATVHESPNRELNEHGPPSLL